MKFEATEYVLMAFALGASLDEVKNYLQMECGWTTNSININVDYLVKEKFVDKDYEMTELGEDKIRSLVKESSRGIRTMLFDSQSVEDKILLYTYEKFEGTVQQINKWISEQDHFIPVTERHLRDGINNLLNQKMIKITKKDPRVNIPRTYSLFKLPEVRTVLSLNGEQG